MHARISISGRSLLTGLGSSCEVIQDGGPIIWPLLMSIHARNGTLTGDLFSLVV